MTAGCGLLGSRQPGRAVSRPQPVDTCSRQRWGRHSRRQRLPPLASVQSQRRYYNAHALSAVGSPKPLVPPPPPASIPQPEQQATDTAPSADAPASASKNEAPKATFRFWYDERRFKGMAERSIVQQALFEAGGVRTGGYPKAAPIPGPLGWERMDDWDLLWSPGRSAINAAPKLKAGQLLPCVPGLSSITRKAKLVPTLKAAYGAQAASQLIPESYALPSERGEWTRLVGTPEEGDARLWILKTGQHLGKGLKLLPGPQAIQAALQRRAAAKPYVMAQRYVDDPLLIDGCKFGIRVWVLVSCARPYRAYLHSNALILFSTQQYEGDRWEVEGGAMAEGHVTNYAMNINGAVWDLPLLRDYIGGRETDEVWQRITRNAALTFAAALPTVRQEAERNRLRGNCVFEVLGLDYLVDSSLRPWLLEVNATPSLAVEHADPRVEDLIFQQKMGMVRDMVQLLDLRNRFSARYKKVGAALSAEERVLRYGQVYGQAPDGDFRPYVRQELGRAGGWAPLMPHFPYDDRMLGWSAEDLLLRDTLAAEGLMA